VCSLFLGFNWVHVVEGVEVLAHDHSLSPLLLDLALLERFEEHGDDHDVSDGIELHGGKDSSSCNISEVVVSDEDHVCSGEHTAKQGGSGEYSLGVVHSLDDCLVLLPLVGVHMKSIY
jgi:hypothetical protein